ncbi:MAG: DNA repair protein RecN [Lachnospiraceae bacterium]|nr:DNA repair protein RecN [Lachnospiraceae bacterium]
MLVSLHVKNLALIEEEEINFGRGLNILSGETGAGKSIILGALSLALGGKVSKDALRNPNEDALAEAVFTVGEKEKEFLSAMDVSVYDDEVILSRKISGERASAKINGETYPASKLKEVGALLLDIYGQHENQSLLNKKKHLELLDEFANDSLSAIKKELSEAYGVYVSKKKEFLSADQDESNRARELSFLEHETEEIQNAKLRVGEDEELEEEYKKLVNGQKISEALNDAYNETSGNGGNSASDQIGRAMRSLRSVESYDEGLSDLVSILTDVDGILGDFNRGVSEYLSSLDFAGEHFLEVESRLNEINDLKNKYGHTIEEVLLSCDEKLAKIEQLRDYDAYLERLEQDLNAAKKRVEELSSGLSVLRQSHGVTLCSLVRDALLDLNFLDVKFDMSFEKAEDYSANGYDICEFMISTNPGEPLRPLKDIASGGELSRVMLAIKTILAESDSIDTLIFDEIDAGISGRTAQAVSEKIYLVSKAHQVILITHLPQIAAMADHHFLIEKDVIRDDKSQKATISTIQELYADQVTKELARMVGGAEITTATMENARELKELADEKKASFAS